MNVYVVIQPLSGKPVPSTEILSITIRYELFLLHIDFPTVQRAGQAVFKVISDILALVERLYSWLEVRIADAYVNKKEEV